MAGVLKNIFSISEDELNHRMNVHDEVKVEPGRKAVAILEAAIDKVLVRLGVDVSDPELIATQMDNLGIIMTEHTDEKAPQLNGFFVFAQSGDDLIPYAWVGSARLERDGKCFCDIHYFQDNRLDEVGGVKVVG